MAKSNPEIKRTNKGGTAIGGTSPLDKQGEAGGCRDAYDQKK